MANLCSVPHNRKINRFRQWNRLLTTATDENDAELPKQTQVLNLRTNKLNWSDCKLLTPIKRIEASVLTAKSRRNQTEVSRRLILTMKANNCGLGPEFTRRMANIWVN
jgi:hypothetical protein